MGVISNLTGFNVGYTFVPTLSDTATVDADAANPKATKYVWVLPLATGALAGVDVSGNSFTVTFAAKDLNLVFPIPFKQLKATGSGTGPISSVSLTSGGTGYSIASGVSVTGGTGSGGKINILAVNTGVITSISLNTAGTGYTVGDVVTVSGGGANATVTVTNISVSGRIMAVFPQ